MKCSEADIANCISAVVRITGFSAAIAARMLAEDKIKKMRDNRQEKMITGKIYAAFRETFFRK